MDGLTRKWSRRVVESRRHAAHLQRYAFQGDHGAKIEDDCLIGIGAIVLNGAIISAGSVVAASAVVPEGMLVPPGTLVRGVPGRVVRPVDAELRRKIEHGAKLYVERGRAAASLTYDSAW